MTEPFEQYWVTIFGTDKDGPLEIEITKDLKQTLSKHKEQKRKLLYFETTNHISAAELREEQIKSWKKSWQARLVRNVNPQWADLFEQIDLQNDQIQNPNDQSID